MSDYAIGDVQGCYEALDRLLQHIQFNEAKDTLWFVGDLVSRGPDSLAVLRLIYSLRHCVKLSLGNHDLHFLACLFDEGKRQEADKSLQMLLAAEDAIELGHWLRKQSFLCYSKDLNVVVCHAGIAPCWDLITAQRLASELADVLSGEDFMHFLHQMYGNEPNLWSDDLSGIDRLRAITNYFTRMRYCDGEGRLDLSYKGPLNQAPAHLVPWYEVPGRVAIEADIVFGHWASLGAKCHLPNIHPIDSGCLWGGSLTALRLQDKKRFSVPCIF